MLDRNSRLYEVYAHPLGRDILNKVLLQLGRSRRWLVNPAVSRLTLGRFEKLAHRVVGPGFIETLLSLLNGEPDRPGGGPIRPAWWKNAVFYQIYPRSFQDSNGDGVGDLAGITSRLDYLSWLGVDCLWLSPVFDSPNEDMGYDVRDYRQIMAEMGTMADMEELISGCHERGMRIILDLVVNHTSAEHPWFRAAVADPHGPYGDYYFLREGPTPPNNWDSFFSGSAWRWIPEAERWALHLFAPGQMDLNWDNPAVRREVAEIVRFWRAKGVDGFRMDVINYISKAPGLPDGNEFIGRLMGFHGIEHYFYGPKLRTYLTELRHDGFWSDGAAANAVATREPAGEPGVMVGETPGIGIETGRLLSGDGQDCLDMVFNFNVLDNPGKTRWDDYPFDLNYLWEHYREYLGRTTEVDTIAYFLENHDNPRMISKILGARHRNPVLRDRVGKLLATMQLTLPGGSTFIYQGQEIAAVNQPFESVDELRDIESINRFAELRADGATLGGAFSEILAGTRDHARTPLPWEPASQPGQQPIRATPGRHAHQHPGVTSLQSGGQPAHQAAGPAPGRHSRGSAGLGPFTRGQAWLREFEAGKGFSVAEQRANPDSVLNFYRRLIALRRENSPFTSRRFRIIAPGSRDYAGWVRSSSDGKELWLVEVNLAGRHTQRRATNLACEVVLGTRADRDGRMEPYESVIARIKRR